MNQVAARMSAFHLVGERPPQGSERTTAAELRPALFAGFRDLSRPRYDFPLVLIDAGPAEEPLVSLADLVGAVLRQVAPPGKEGEPMRRQVLGLEQEIRNLVVGGKPQSLGKLWDAAQRRLAEAAGEGRVALEKNLAGARKALPCDGRVIGYDGKLPARLASHVWTAAQREGLQHLRHRIDSLSRRLSEILEIDRLGRGRAREASYLEGSVGATDQSQFDFAAMANVLCTAPAGNPLPDLRRSRIRAAIEVLHAQRFVPRGEDNSAQGYGYEFDSCRSAMDAFRKRLPEMAKLVRAMGIAELEIANRYDTERHDAYFERFGVDSLGPDDIAAFPSYFVRLGEGADTAEGQGALFEMLASNLPFKILLQTNHLPVGVSATTSSGSGVPPDYLAEMALALNEPYVVQAVGSSLYRLRDALSQALSGSRPALISVYSGADGGGMDAYLKAAAASESRAFPCFFHDPQAGPAGAARISLDGNPRPDEDWPIHTLEYEDAKYARKSLETAFTLADFAACDARCAEHLAVVDSEDWHESMLPLDRFLELTDEEVAELVPYVLLIDGENRLKRAVVDERLSDAAVRCRDHWRRLQERAGIGEKQAEAMLEEARKAWEAEKAQLLAEQAALGTGTESASQPQSESDVHGAAEKASGSTAKAPGAPQPAAEEPEPASDEPWIESIRCTSCNECTDLNNRMFAYDEDQRAYIADPDAGTYRELVEAAESCQVAIIHPGKPRNPDEPGLEELIKRAEPFI